MTDYITHLAGGAMIDPETEELLRQLARLEEPRPAGWSRFTAGQREIERDRRKHCGQAPRRPCPFPRYMTVRR